MIRIMLACNSEPSFPTPGLPNWNLSDESSESGINQGHYMAWRLLGPLFACSIYSMLFLQ
jgi:hypothetical protein